LAGINPALAVMIDGWQKNPVLFVKECLKVKRISKWQREALEALGNGERRIAIRSGHGVGKSTFLAWTMLWFQICHFPHKVMATANRQDQLSDVLWAECKAWHKVMMPEVAQFLEFTSDKIVWKDAPESGFAIARTARKENPEAFQGIHQKHMLLIADEASGIDNIIFETGVGAMSTPGAITLLTGNPTRTQGYFYDAFHKASSLWWTRKVSVDELIEEGAAYVAVDFPAEVATTFGRDSNAYRVRVLGEFPTSEDDQVIPRELVDEASVRDVEQSDVFRTVWGVDVARFGDDRTALCKRRGNILLEPIKSWRHKDTMQVAGIVMNEYTSLPPSERPSEILVDVIGLGAGVVDRLWELGLPVTGVNVAESASSKERYSRSRDELWFKAREWFQERRCFLDDPELAAELCSVLYTFSSSGKILVESKSDMKKRGMPSPDLADSFILTFAGGIDVVEEHELERYSRYKINKKHQRTTSWMAA